MCLTETFTGSLFDYTCLFPDFVKFTAPAKKLSHQGRYSGGVLVLIKRQFSKFVKEIKLNDCNNVIALRLDKNVLRLKKDVIIVACYINPDGSPAYNDFELNDGILILEEALLQLRGDNVYWVVCGDLNARTGTVQPDEEEMEVELRSDDNVNNVRQSKDGSINKFGKSLLDFCFLFNLYIMNGFCPSDADGEFTFVSTQGCSVIDYFLVSKELYMKCDLKVLNEVFSWHLPVQLLWVVDPPTISKSNASCVKAQTDERIVWSEDSKQTFKDELNSNIFLDCLNNAKELITIDLEKSVEAFEKVMYGAAACMVKKVGNKKTWSEWFDRECSNKKRLVKAALQRYRRTKDIEAKTEKKRIYINERKEYVKMIKTKKREYEEKRLQNLKESAKDSKLFWSTIRQVNRKRIISNEISIQQWYDHFHDVFNVEEGNFETNEENVIDDTDEHLFNENITAEEVINGIKKLKSGKSAGPDKIIGEMLKCANNSVIEYLVLLFNFLFERGRFQLDWSKSIIVPIHKKGDLENPDNYRGVALTSIVSKAYTYILNRRLVQWVEREEKIVEEQAGFRAGYSTVDHIFTLYALVEKFLAKNTKLYVAFVDFRKAFDSVNRNALWQVLRNSGVSGKLYWALRGVYDSVLACVRDKGNYSEYFNCPQGVKQGCLLSPQLFSFFINELAVEVSKRGRHGIQLVPGAIEIFMLLFADDVVLMSSTVIGLQNQLNVLREEATRLHLCVNMDKTNIIVFRKGGHLSAWEKWWYGNIEVKITNAYKYLGMTFTTRLSLNTFWDEISSKGKKGVIEILRCMRKLKSMDFRIFWKLFDTQIEPILSYAAEIWGLDENIQAERVHTYAIKRFLNVPIHSSNTVVYGETGRYPLYIRMYVKSVKYWLRLITLPRERLCKQAYDLLFRQSELGHLNWASKVKLILTTNGFGIVWLNHTVGHERRFLKSFTDRLVCCFKQNWHSKMNENVKYCWFSSFKDLFQPEKYLLLITNKWHRDSMARFRARTMGLTANKRWYMSTVENEICPICKEQAIENEEHFIFHCNAYSDLRTKSLLFNFEVTRFLNIRCLLTNENEKVIFALGKFIAEAMNIRKGIIVMNK